jgi:hypothetical protein
MPDGVRQLQAVELIRHVNVRKHTRMFGHTTSKKQTTGRQVAILNWLASRRRNYMNGWPTIWPKEPADGAPSLNAAGPPLARSGGKPGRVAVRAILMRW